MPVVRELSARTEPFDSYWQAPKDIERGYTSFRQYYRANFLPHLPPDRAAKILVVSCGPGYLVQLLKDEGYTAVVGIDSDPDKIGYAERRKLPCRVAEAFPFLESVADAYDLILCEQELNHLTKDETIEFLRLCHRALRPGGGLLVYGLNGANPITGAEALSQNFDHFYTFTEYSLLQILELCGFEQCRALPLKLYVFYRNPLNYVGWGATILLETIFRVLFRLYGKSAKIFTKKIAAVCRKPRQS
ncbi:MAG TPA: class I SAM-dependent methyltransferase [Candidatus Polarisedimenticolaceae bacterium]|nr:class I SAM-dependent methyltransferase [Candidatus Polarisedimenticolaceae bacterium]